MDSAKRTSSEEDCILKDNPAELIGRLPRMIERTGRRSQRAELRNREKQIRPVKGGSAAAICHRQDLLRFRTGKSRSHTDSAAIRPQQEIARLADLIRNETDRVNLELRNINLDVETGGQNDVI
ncbi:MAG: hypothetical protein U0R19_33775 [Bryobacteraceae bacterium]